MKSPLSFPLLALAALSSVAFGGCASSANKTPDTAAASAENAASNAAATAEIKPVTDQRALDALKKMSDALAQAKSMQFETASMMPFRGPNGQWLHLLKTAHVEMQRPNRLHVETGGDAFPQSIHYDGKQYSVESKETHLYTQTDMPADSIDAVLAESAKRGAYVFSFSDVLLANPYASWTDELQGAVYVGESNRNKEKLVHLALVAKTVHWEVWIGAKDHLPRLVYARYVGEQHTPTIMVEFSKWKLNGTMPAQAFAFKAPKGAKRAALKTPKTTD